MSDALIKRASELNDTIEFSLKGRSLAISIGFFLLLAYFIVHPSKWLILFHWPWLSALLAFLVLAGILRNVSWSPFYIGPTITLTSTDVKGRGGWGHERWHVQWSELDRIESGRNGLFIYKKGLKSWDVPYCQPGAVSRTIVRCINERRKAYQERHEPERNFPESNR